MNNILECKICGGNIIPNADTITGKCESCGATTVIPKETTNSNKINRANYLRRANDFEKGIELFEEIIRENSQDSEAYWGLVLCKFGIEYVDDVDGSKKPTCHRTMSESILNDPDYKAALDNAVGIARYLYEEEALKIDEIQKKIKAIAANEQPYDIFICYKESDELGQRTHDSVDVQEIYNRLTNKGFKVFFARKTLQNKLGEEYEPIIYAALSSAKVMLVYGSQPDYFTGVWVKNEWSRFRRMMKSEPEKKIIPIFDGSKMSAYDLPNELADFQAFDKYRVGFIEDLVEGIQKIISYNASNNAKTNENEYSQSSDSSTNGLIERAFMFLSEGLPEKADEYFERVLDINPRNVNAYIGKLMIEYKIGEIGEFETLKTDKPLETSGNYTRILKYGNERTRQQFTYYNDCSIYNQAEYILNTATSSELIDTAIRLFKSIPDIKDAREKAKADKEKYLQYNNCVFKMKNSSEDENLVEELKNTFEMFGNFRDSAKLVEECRLKLLEMKYKNAVRLMDDANKHLKKGFCDINEIRNIKSLFGSMIEYKDCSQKVNECDNMILETTYNVLVKRMNNCISDFNTTEEEYSNLAESFLELVNYKNAQRYAQVCRDKSKEVKNRNLFNMKAKKIVIFFLISLPVLAILLEIITSYN